MLTSLHLLSDGTFKLDGGAMHGVVPTSLWQKQNSPDEQNRILLGLNSLLLNTGNEKILIEPGIGFGHSEKFASIFCVEKQRSMLAELQFLGVHPNDISIVIPTHLHFDHAGGFANWKTGELLYPKARIILQKKEWEAALNPHPKNIASYLPEFLNPLKKGKLETVDGTQEIASGVEVVYTGGHTHGHQVVFIKHGGLTFAFLGDLVPTGAHVNPLWVMAYDVDPEQSIFMKKKFITESVTQNWNLILVHDPHKPVGKVTEENGKYTYIPTLKEPWVKPVSLL